MIIGKGGDQTTFDPLDRLRLSPDGVNSEQQFAAVLERECARADRNGHGFSLVTFKVRNKAGCRDFMKKMLCGQLRLTDEVGWFDGERLGVLLFNTHEEGARTYAGRVCNAMAAEGGDPDCSVYTYPTSWPDLETEKACSTDPESEKQWDPPEGGGPVPGFSSLFTFTRGIFRRMRGDGYDAQ